MDYPPNLTESDRHWLDLIQQCRASGKSDYQWLQENNIKSPTFYYHLKRLRNKACEIPDATRKASKPEIQEVVPVFFENEEITISGTHAPVVDSNAEASDSSIAIRLQVHGICVEIANSASQIVIQNTLSALRNLC